MAEQPIRTCYQSTFANRICDACGKIALVVHMPTARIGYFCGKCCPACKTNLAKEK
jgi:hypothetical protein